MDVEYLEISRQVAELRFQVRNHQPLKKLGLAQPVETGHSQRPRALKPALAENSQSEETRVANARHSAGDPQGVTCR